MRHLSFATLILISLLLLAANQTAQAEWCASYRNGSSNCYFKTQAQCQAAVSGIGGFCSGTDSQSAARRPAAVDAERSPRSERSARSERPVRNSRTKPAREEATKEARRPPPPSPAVARTEKTPAFAVGDDERIVPAEPDDAQPTLASISETNVTPSVPAGERSSGFIAARDLVLRGNYQAGLAALQNLNPSGDPDVAAYTGFAYSKLGRPADAKGWYQKALALDPNHLWALSYYGLLMLEEGNLRAARENLDKIRTICGGVGCYAYASLQAAIANKR